MEKKFVNTLQNLIACGVSIFFGLIIAGFLKQHVIFNAVVPSESMYPTVGLGDLLVGSRLSYLLSEPQRGDVVTFEDPDGSGVTFLKRIIGLPGESLVIIDGLVYINGGTEALYEPYLNPANQPEGSYGPYEVPEGSYFVMGDNRNESYDSRFWEATFVSLDEISSKIIFKYHPRFEIFD